MPLAWAIRPSESNSSFSSSSFSRSDTTESTCALRHPRTSSSSQSPPRGRVEIASCPRHGSVIRNRSGIMFFSILHHRKPNVGAYTAMRYHGDFSIFVGIAVGYADYMRVYTAMRYHEISGRSARDHGSAVAEVQERGHRVDWSGRDRGSGDPLDRPSKCGRRDPRSWRIAEITLGGEGQGQTRWRPNHISVCRNCRAHLPAPLLFEERQNRPDGG